MQQCIAAFLLTAVINKLSFFHLFTPSIKNYHLLFPVVKNVSEIQEKIDSIFPK